MIGNYYIPQILLTIAILVGGVLLIFSFIDLPLYTKDRLSGKTIECNSVGVFFKGTDRRVLERYAAELGGKIVYYDKEIDMYKIGFKWHCDGDFVREMIKKISTIPGVEKAFVNSPGDAHLPAT
jgi:hypothetical protein